MNAMMNNANKEPVIAPRVRPFRSGTTMIEVMVAFTLLTTALSVSLPLVVRHGRLLASHREYRLALDEVSNQLDRLTALPQAELSKAMEQLSVSRFTAGSLPDAELQGELEPADIGRRITLRLSWGGPQRQTLSLAAWVFPATPQASELAAGDDES